MDTKWMIEHQSRLDQNLHSYLLDRLLKLKYIPFVLMQSLLKRMKVSVLIQWDESRSNQFTTIHNPLTQQGFPVKKYIRSIHTFSLPLSIASLQQLLSIRDIKKIYLDRKVKVCLDVATPTTQSPQIWSKGNEGNGVTIAIVDTGIAPHPDINSRLIAFHDIINQKSNPYDDNGHGTHCAGCAAGDGNQSNGKYKGPAPKASLVGVKVLGKSGEGNLSNVIAGIDWCIEHQKQYNIRVISLSLGSETKDSYKDDPVCQVVQKAWDKGIVVVAAAGNSGPHEKTIASPGITPDIITVGATDSKRTLSREDDHVASFSSRGPTPDGMIKPDIVAPGTDIISLRSKGSYLDLFMFRNRVGSDYFKLSGTSMATPIVAGITALLLSEYPNLSPNEIKNLLLNNTFPLQNESETAQGKGLVDAIKAYSNSGQ
ncbi:S8 family peptidase [Thermoflavimicrobium daqui]|nr:S8 family peptidase [Thermoflavimicrobium daqui]